MRAPGGLIGLSGLPLLIAIFTGLGLMLRLAQDDILSRMTETQPGKVNWSGASLMNASGVCRPSGYRASGHGGSKFLGKPCSDGSRTFFGS